MRTAMCEGWKVVDNSTTSVGPDKTSVTEWRLSSGVANYKISEIFGDWAINGLFVASNRSDIDRALVKGGLPTLAAIEEAINQSKVTMKKFYMDRAVLHAVWIAIWECADEKRPYSMLPPSYPGY